MHVIWLIVNDLCIYCHSFLNVITREKTDFSVVTYARLLLSFCLHKLFLTIDCKLAFRSSSIQSTTDGENNVLHYILSFHSDVHHNTEEKICRYFSTTSLQHFFISYDLDVWNISWLLFLRMTLISICKCADLCQSQSFSGDDGCDVWELAQSVLLGV